MKEKSEEQYPGQVKWPEREGWQPFGNRLNFLSPEQQHLQAGGLKILPPKERE